MSSSRVRPAGVVTTVVCMVLIAALSRVPFAPAGSTDALIRLSWRTTGEYVEECRRLSEAELEAIPIHMRREEVCEGRMVPYRLRMVLDGRTVYDEQVRAAGAREDRPLYVFRELRVVPGAYDLQVSWDPEERRPEGAPGLSLRARLELAAGEVSLITYDMDRRVLVPIGSGTVTLLEEAAPTAPFGEADR